MSSDQDPSRSGGLRASLAGLPRWAHALLGALALGLGAVLIVRPTTTLGLMALLIGAGLILAGVLQLVGRPPGDAPGSSRPVPVWRIALAGLWAAAGVFVLVFPGLTVRLTAVIVGVGLILSGLGSVARGLRPRIPLDARVAEIATGLAVLVLGVLALVWPDITLLVVAVALGASLIVGGVLELWQAARGTRRSAPREPRGIRRVLRTVAALVALVLAGGAAAVSTSLHEGSPVVDDFYAAPRQVPDEPGRLVRAEALERGIPDDARAWRILYTTTRGDGEPAVASGIVVVPATGDGDWPVIDWTHGTTGYARDCAPSLADHPLESGAMFVLPQVVDAGWAMVATDYLGLGTEGPHPYLIGADTAHAVLDAARAARELDEADLGDRDVIWGHSQGGGGALWAGALADEYAPELDVEGVAAYAPASDLVGLVGDLPEVAGGSLFASYVIAAYTSVYDDVTYRQNVRPGAEATVRAMAERCLAAEDITVSVLELLALGEDPDVIAGDPTTGALGARLEQNTPPPTIDAPLLLGQGSADRLILPGMQDAFVQRLCDAGQQVDYRRYAGRDHVPLVEADSPAIPELFDWTRDRLAGIPVDPGCTRVDR